MRIVTSSADQEQWSSQVIHLSPERQCSTVSRLALVAIHFHSTNRKNLPIDCVEGVNGSVAA